MSFEYLYSVIHSNISWAPYIILFLFFLAGLNLPVSEDLIILVAALLASDSPEHMPHLFVSLYLGAYLSDVQAYAIGRFFADKLFKIKLFAKTLTPQRVNTVTNYLERFGVAVYLVGRFIPFGVRNLMFMTSGIIKFNFIKFAIFDTLAALITCSIYFTLYYQFGLNIVSKIKKGNIIIFIAFIIMLFIIVITKLVIIPIFKKNLKKKQNI